MIRARAFRKAASPARQLSLALAAGFAVVLACSCAGLPVASSSAPAPSGQPARQVYLSPEGFRYDLVTPAGIEVQTNGQYKTAAGRESAAATIDRYWHAVSACVDQSLPPHDATIADTLLPEFPDHLTIVIVPNWKVVEGAETHIKRQAFPSLRTPGAWVSASREEGALEIEVVPELSGLGPQMAGEVNQWLGGHTSELPGDLSNVCAAVPCYRFDYNNAPSEAWRNCVN